MREMLRMLFEIWTIAVSRAAREDFVHFMGMLVREEVAEGHLLAEVVVTVLAAGVHLAEDAATVPWHF